MRKLPSPTGKRLIAALKKAGFAVIRVRGSHHFLRHADGRSTVVPVHASETIGPGYWAESYEIAILAVSRWKNYYEDPTRCPYK
jgi:predicted RNA binding protein YcfA (HicA-like mRNA interferase family)